MSKILPIIHIEEKPDSGKPRIIGKGVTVQFLAQMLGKSEWPVERICEEFGLTPAEVYAAWSYYYDHQEEIETRIQSEREESEKLLADPEYQAQIATLKKSAHRHQ